MKKILASLFLFSPVAFAAPQLYTVTIKADRVLPNTKIYIDTFNDKLIKYKISKETNLLKVKLPKGDYWFSATYVPDDGAASKYIVDVQSAVIAKDTTIVLKTHLAQQMPDEGRNAFKKFLIETMSTNVKCLMPDSLSMCAETKISLELLKQSAAMSSQFQQVEPWSEEEGLNKAVFSVGGKEYSLYLGEQDGKTKIIWTLQ